MSNKIDEYTTYNVYYAPDGCGEEYCGEYDTYEDAVEAANKGPSGLEESMYETARKAGHVAGLTAPDKTGEAEEPISWHGPDGWHCVVKCTNTPIYEYREPSGHTEYINASTFNDALEIASEWLCDGSYDIPAGCYLVPCELDNYNHDQYIATVTVYDGEYEIISEDVAAIIYDPVINATNLNELENALEGLYIKDIDMDRIPTFSSLPAVTETGKYNVISSDGENILTNNMEYSQYSLMQWSISDWHDECNYYDELYTQY